MAAIETRVLSEIWLDDWFAKMTAVGLRMLDGDVGDNGCATSGHLDVC